MNKCAFEIDVYGGEPLQVLVRTEDYVSVASFPLADIPRRVDAGEFDDMPGLDADLFSCWLEETPKETIQESDCLLFWRWLIAATFIMEQQQANGTVSVEWRPGEWKECAMYCGERGGMNLHPLSERLAMANNIEGALIEKFGEEEGTRNAIEFYRGMRGADGYLTEMGRDVLSKMHDYFIEIIESGELPSPVEH